MQSDTDAPAHANDHRLAVHRLQAFPEVRHQIGGDQLDALGTANRCLRGRAFDFEFIPRVLLLANQGDFLASTATSPG